MTFRSRFAPREEAAPPPSGFIIGFNFRATAGYPNQADDTMDYWTNGAAWPTLFSGRDSDARAGYWAPDGTYYVPGPGEEHFNRTATNDPRLAGDHGFSALDRAYRIEVPVGTYRVWIGAGVPTVAHQYNLDIYDGLSGQSLEYASTAQYVNPANFNNILGTEKNAATWVADYPNDYTTVTVTNRGAETGLDFRLRRHPPFGPWTYFNHIRVEQQ